MSDCYDSTAGIEHEPPRCRPLPWYRRIHELFTDPASCTLSMSRTCLGLMNVCGAVAGLYLAFHGGGAYAVGILAGIAASDAGVYFASTRKISRGECNRPGPGGDG